MIKNKVYTISFAFLLIQYIFLFLILPQFYTIQSEKIIYLVPVTVILLGILQYILLKNKIEKKQIDSVIYVVAVNGFKFIIMLFALLFYILYVSKNHKEFVAIFFSNYFFSLILINSVLIMMLKKNK